MTTQTVQEAFDEIWEDFPEQDCCKRAAFIIYRAGIVMPNCYEGTRDLWCDPGVPLMCNDSIMMVGEYVE